MSDVDLSPNPHRKPGRGHLWAIIILDPSHMNRLEEGAKENANEETMIRKKKIFEL